MVSADVFLPGAPSPFDTDLLLKHLRVEFPLCELHNSSSTQRLNWGEIHFPVFGAVDLLLYPTPDEFFQLIVDENGITLIVDIDREKWAADLLDQILLNRMLRK